MADAVIRGDIEGVNREVDDIRASISCVRGTPTGSIRGEIEIETGLRDREFRFSSNRPTFLQTIREGFRRIVIVRFRRVTLKNVRTNRIFRNCTLLLIVRRLANGRQQALLIIRCPGRRQLRVSGRFDGLIEVNREVTCRR